MAVALEAVLTRGTLRVVAARAIDGDLGVVVVPSTVVIAVAILDVWELAGTRPPRHAPGEHGGTAVFTRSGPYGWVRHPIYSGWFLVVFSVPAMTATQLVFAVASSAYLVVGMVFEERSLVSAAPEAYRAYQRDVRWKVIPGVY